MSTPPRRAYLPPQASDFHVYWRGREVRWLSRLVGSLLARIARRRRRPRGTPPE